MCRLTVWQTDRVLCVDAAGAWVCLVRRSSHSCRSCWLLHATWMRSPWLPAQWPHTKWKMLILQTSTHIIQIQKKPDLPLPSQSFLYFPNYAECATCVLYDSPYFLSISKTDYFLLYTDQFKSRLCAGQSVTFILGFWREACWMTKRRTRLSFAFLRVSFRIFTNPSFFMIPSILTRFSAADALKHSHSIILPPLFGLWVVHLFLLSPNISNVSALEP